MTDKKSALPGGTVTETPISLVIKAPRLSVSPLKTLQLKCTANFKSGPKDVTSLVRWRSSNGDILEIGGLYVNSHPGPSIITATLGNIISNALTIADGSGPRPRLNNIIMGTVRDAYHLNYPVIANATVKATPSSPLITGKSNGMGIYSILAKQGIYTLTCSAPGFQNSVSQGQSNLLGTLVHDFWLYPVGVPIPHSSQIQADKSSKPNQRRKD